MRSTLLASLPLARSPSSAVLRTAELRVPRSRVRLLCRVGVREGRREGRNRVVGSPLEGETHHLLAGPREDELGTGERDIPPLARRWEACPRTSGQCSPAGRPVLRPPTLTVASGSSRRWLSARRNRPACHRAPSRGCPRQSRESPGPRLCPYWRRPLPARAGRSPCGTCRSPRASSPSRGLLMDPAAPVRPGRLDLLLIRTIGSSRIGRRSVSEWSKIEGVAGVLAEDGVGRSLPRWSAPFWP